MPIAVLTFRFDPYAHLFGDLSVRWGAIALTVVIVAALILAARMASATGLRANDVAFVAVGIVPGAVIGGRLGYVLLHQASFASLPTRLIDPAYGGFELGLAVVGGTLTGMYVARLLDPGVGRWLHVAVAPVLFGLGAGKLAMVLTGSGQGAPSDGAWATAYAGNGPWATLVPVLPSHPSQAYEGIATLVILVAVVLTLWATAFGRHDGRLFLMAVGMWAVARAFISTTWRDPVAVAGLNVGGLIAIGIAIGCLLLFAAFSVSARMGGRVAPGETETPAWPESRSRSGF